MVEPWTFEFEFILNMCYCLSFMHMLFNTHTHLACESRCAAEGLVMGDKDQTGCCCDEEGGTQEKVLQDRERE